MEIEIEENSCLIDMKAMVERAKLHKLVPNCCIYRVPQTIRELNEEAYTPKVVSIGPLHHGDKRLEAIEELKLGYLKSYLERTDMKLEDRFEKIKKNEAYIRSCYAMTISQSSDEFVKMILIDACFIIEHFLRTCDPSVWIQSDPILSKPSLVMDMWRDVILLENQLPFFALEDLFTPTCINDSQYSSFLEVCFHYFRTCYNNIYLFENDKFTIGYFREHHLKTIRLDEKSEEVQVQHLIDLLRIFHLPCCKLQPKRQVAVQHLYSARQLLEAGVKFKFCQNKSLTELQFEKGVLTIPQFCVDSDTETCFKNMTAFEQCHYPYETNIGDYINLMQFLINNSKCVDILVDKGILVNRHWEKDKVAAIFINICRGLTFANCNADYVKLSKNLKDFYEKPLHKYKAILIRDYFSTPWKMASSIAAIVLLLLTLIQTICSTVPLL